MITGSPIPDGSGWVPIPNQTARDPRLDRRDLGLLVELLSYPSGWDNNADRLSAKRGEGRDATRRSMGRLEEAGYVIHLRYRAERGRWLTASFAGSSPEVARSLADAWLAEHPTSNVKEKPSSHRRTGFQASADQASETQAFNTYKTDDNTEERRAVSDAAGAASLALNASALSMESDDADASSAAAKAAAREDDRSTKPKRQKPPTLDQRLDAHLAALGPDTIDEMYQDLDNDRTGILTWAVKKARKTLGLPWSDDPEDDPGGPLARKAVALALMALSKPDGGGITPTVEMLLGDFDWPDERMPSAARPGAKERPVLPRVEYYRALDGASDDDVHQTLYKQVDALDDDELAARVEWLRTYRPGIYRQCSENAAAQAERGGGDWSSRDLDNLTFKYAIRHYEGRWPMFVVPTAERGTA